jgi:hypothetical protein
MKLSNVNETALLIWKSNIAAGSVLQTKDE